MNQIIERLWEELVGPCRLQEEELVRVRELLYTRLTAAAGTEFTDTVRDSNTEAEDSIARAAFQKGFCLGGQLVLSMLSDDFTPS